MNLEQAQDFIKEGGGGIERLENTALSYMKFINKISQVKNILRV